MINKRKKEKINEKNLQDYELYILTGDACLYIFEKQPEGICDNKDKSEFDDYE